MCFLWLQQWNVWSKLVSCLWSIVNTNDEILYCEVVTKFPWFRAFSVQSTSCNYSSSECATMSHAELCFIVINDTMIVRREWEHLWLIVETGSIELRPVWCRQVISEIRSLTVLSDPPWLRQHSTMFHARNHQSVTRTNATDSQDLRNLFVIR